MLYILIYIYILCSYIKETRVSGEATVSGSEPHEERVDTRHSRLTTNHLRKNHSVLLTEPLKNPQCYSLTLKPLAYYLTSVC